ncbi:hypothetical protein MRAB57_558, partial [Mycobacterium rhizamassiliense]|jgi:hypothetical protein
VADRLDVAERLAEGRIAVEHTQAYVRACQALGYQQPDLTSRPSQVRDQFDSEDGLDLRALDHDCTELRAAGDAILEGLRMQRAQAAELAAAWTGPAGEAAGRFLQRHGDAANMVVTEVRAAAQRCESLRDNLWYLLDSKVSSAIAIDDRSQLQRDAWLAAAAVVTGGAGERSTAEQVVGQQVMPYVDNDIRNDWLASMRSSLAGCTAAYDMVINRMAAVPAVYFDSPGNIEPGLPALQPVPPNAPELPSATVPSAVTEPVAAQPPMVSALPAVPAPDAAPVPPAAAVPDLGSALDEASALPADAAGLGGLGGLGDMGSGSGGLGGLGGLASRIVDAMSGLLGSGGDQLGDPSTLDDSLDDKDPFDEDDSDDDPFHPVDDKADADEKDADPEKDDEAVKPEDAQEVRPVDGSPPADAPPLPGDGPPPATAPEPAGAPVPPASEPGPTDGATPCEIAADQLPQAGQ